MKRKEVYLDLMSRLGMTYYKDVSRAIASYYIAPADAVEALASKLKP
jgi:hypothetical protein